MKVLTAILSVALLVGLAASVAFAIQPVRCVDVEIAVSPTVAKVGDVVSVYASLENCGDSPEMVQLDATLEKDGDVVKLGRGHVRMAAGEKLVKEMDYPVPDVPAGVYTLTVTASVPGYSDTATATLEVIE